MTEEPPPGSDAPRTPLQRWLDAASAELGVSAQLDRDLVLDLARDAAHGVARPAAPLTAYLLGVAVGAGADPRTAAARLTELARDWPATKPADQQ